MCVVDPSEDDLLFIDVRQPDDSQFEGNVVSGMVVLFFFFLYFKLKNLNKFYWFLILSLF